MKKNTYLNIGITLVLIIILISTVYNLYISILEPIIYKNSYIFTSDIKTIKQYELVQNMLDYYISRTSMTSEDLKYFFVNDDIERHKKYSEYLSNKTKILDIVSAKKTITNIYIIEYKLTFESEDIYKLVVRFDKNNSCRVYYDSLYEEVTK